MNLAEPSWLLWLPAAFLVGVAIAIGATLRRNRLAEVFSPHLLAQVLPRSVRARRVVRDVAAVLGLALGLVALSEPRFDKQIRTVKTVGTDLVILLDLSRSMDARDVDPSRLERARREIRDLARLATGDRVGLVVFAGGAYPRLPLTEDFRAVELVVSETDTSTFESQGSSLGQAIRAGVELLQRSQDQAGQALIVLSDGETHEPEDALDAASMASGAGIRIYAMGIGVDATPIPLPSGRLLEYNGEVAMSNPDFSVLKDVARTTGGAFVESIASDQDMSGLYGEIRRSLRAIERSSQQRESWRTAYHWPLGLGVVLLLLAGWLGDGRRRWGAAAAVLLVALSAPGSASAADPILDADRSYRSGEFERAVEILTELSLENPDDAEVFERLGAARYRTGDWEGAARAYDQAANLEASEADSLFNAGNAHYRVGRLEQALERYDRALVREPDHPGATRNRDLVAQEIELRRQEPPPQEQSGEDNEDQQEGGEGQDSEQEQQQQSSQQEQQQQQQGQPQPSPGQPQPSDQPPQGQGQPQPSKEGPTGDPGQAVEPGELEAQEGDESDGEPQGEGGTTMGEDVGPITEGQAHRLLDAIEEGSQRVTVSGTTERKPW